MGCSYSIFGIIAVAYQLGLCMGSRSVEIVRLNGYIGNIWITEISIVFLSIFFVGLFVFIINVFFR